MSMSAGLGLCTLYYTWQSYPSPQRVVSAMLFGSLYGITAFSALAHMRAKSVYLGVSTG